METQTAEAAQIAVETSAENIAVTVDPINYCKT